MANYFLPGAGFSKSFRGLLCNELTHRFFNSIQDSEIKQYLISGGIGKNFETILSEIRIKFPDKTAAHENILRNIFKDMVSQMTNHHGNQGNGGRFVQDSVHYFFWLFDCIFTTNQDGFSKECGSHYLDKMFLDQRNSAQLSLKKGYCIPYIELHGAYDWEGVFIIGSNKEEEIKKRQKIQKFHEFFEKCLNEKNSKLVVAGYSFCDLHLNKVINEGIKNGLEIFIWDPAAKNIVNGYKPAMTSAEFASREDVLPGIEKNNFQKAIKGYLPINFSLLGNDKNDVINFLKN
jgi:hypothetical protein